jgi:hypothetical protein
MTACRTTNSIIVHYAKKRPMIRMGPYFPVSFVLFLFDYEKRGIWVSLQKKPQVGILVFTPPLNKPWFRT